MPARSSFSFAPGSKAANRMNKCGCGKRKLEREKRCIACQIKRKAKFDEFATDDEPADEWTMVDMFMEGMK